MSDAADDLEFTARQLLNKGKTHALREEMRAFVTEHRAATELENLRNAVTDGQRLSDIVSEGRDERV